MLSANFEITLDELHSALQLMPNNLAAHALLAEAYARLEHWNTSLQWRDKVEMMEPASIEDLILKGRMESYHDADRAEATLDQAIARDKQNIVARLIRGAIRAKHAYDTCDPIHSERALEDLRLASTFLNETSYLLSHFMDAHLTASAAYELEGNIEASQEHLESAGMIAQKLEKYDKHYEAHRWRAYYFERIGDLETAIFRMAGH